MKYMFEMPAEVRAKIKYVASLQGITMNTLILKAVVEFLQRNGEKDERTLEANKRV